MEIKKKASLNCVLEELRRIIEENIISCCIGPAINCGKS
jgi:hypothetical protein